MWPSLEKVNEPSAGLPARERSALLAHGHDRGQVASLKQAEHAQQGGLPTSFYAGSPEDPRQSAADGQQRFSDINPQQDGKHPQGNFVALSRDGS